MTHRLSKMLTLVDISADHCLTINNSLYRVQLRYKIALTWLNEEQRTGLARGVMILLAAGSRLVQSSCRVIVSRQLRASESSFHG